MGSVMTKIKLTNPHDRNKVVEGLLAPAAVRSVEIEALADTGATTMVVPQEVAEALGMPFQPSRPVRLAAGRTFDSPWIAGVWIEILGREMTCDAFIVPRGVGALIGQIPLEGLDLVVDPRSREVRTNPEHPDGPMFYILRVA